MKKKQGSFSLYFSYVSFFITRLGITNYEEYSLIQEQGEDKKEDGMGTLKKERTLLRDERKMEKLKAKLHTDDECEFVFKMLDDILLQVHENCVRKLLLCT